MVNFGGATSVENLIIGALAMCFVRAFCPRTRKTYIDGLT